MLWAVPRNTCMGRIGSSGCSAAVCRALRLSMCRLAQMDILTRFSVCMNVASGESHGDRT